MDADTYEELMADFRELVDRVSWRPIETAPKDGELFILLYCAEDKSRWLAKWQGNEWYGVDEYGLTRRGASAGNPNVVTGWFVNAWMPIPEGPAKIEE